MTHTCTLAAKDQSQRGFSLTELLVAASIAVLLMAAVAQLFSIFGRGLNDSQKTTDLSGRMRTAAWQLRQDLAGITVKVSPWMAPEADAGYIEILEGPLRDASRAVMTAATGALGISTRGVSVGGTVGPGSPTDPYVIPGGIATSDLEADTDDSLLFTTRAASGRFSGRFGAGTAEASCAEIAWFCRAAGSQPVAGTTLYNLYRRQLLVVGYAGSGPFLVGGNAVPTSGSLTSSSAFGQSRPTPLYDLSLRFESGRLVPNSLGDLTKRENRCFLAGGTASLRANTFPHQIITDGSYRLPPEATFDSTDRVYEDVILTNVISFDVRVFDPTCHSLASGTTTLYPGDPGYDPTLAASSTTSSLGGFVDLGWRGGLPIATGMFLSGSFPPTSGTSILQSNGLLVSGTPNSLSLPVTTYDTWSLHYEFNGNDEDGDGLVDEGTDGLDSNADLIPDNLPEYETAPPYPVPLSGIEVRIRCYEPSTQQVRQTSIRHYFSRR